MNRTLVGRLLAPFLAAMLTLSPASGLGCTTFALPQSPEKLVGKNYDWHQTHGLVLVNARNLKKTALLITKDRAAEWTSRYGSLSFNQHGRELPLGGINEKGLTVEIMWLNASEYPAPDSTPALTELQWIQYELDSAATVEEAVKLARAVRVTPAVAKVHYLICDVSGKCASLEYLGKQLVVQETSGSDVAVLTNDPYAASLSFASQLVGKPMPLDSSSLSRFDRASALAKAYDPAKISSPVTEAFSILDSVMQSHTTWNIVYESARQKVHFRSAGLPKTKTVDTSRLDYSCKSVPKFIDMKAPTEGEVTADFIEFERLKNAILVKTGLGPFSSQLPSGTLDRIAKYPDSLECME